MDTLEADVDTADLRPRQHPTLGHPWICLSHLFHASGLPGASRRQDRYTVQGPGWLPGGLSKDGQGCLPDKSSCLHSAPTPGQDWALGPLYLIPLTWRPRLEQPSCNGSASPQTTCPHITHAPSKVREVRHVG
jgi:hypothetical protein